MPKVDVNKKRGDPNAQIDLQTFWEEIKDIKDEKVVNVTGDWDTDFGHVFGRVQNPVEDLIVPLGRLEDGKYGVFNLSIDLNLLAVGSALSGLGVFRRSTLAHLTRAHTPEQLQIVLIDPIRSLSDFDDLPHLAVPRAVKQEEILSALKWIYDEYERRLKFLEEHRGLIHLHNERGAETGGIPRILLLVSELGEVGLENEEIQNVLVSILMMARALEINAILCTQQIGEHRLPDSILKNTPVKLAFKLPYAEDSKRIIGKAGAEKLLGQGDMIYSNDVNYWRMQGFHY
jgi:S-DNA-T family DNA segregation ATPase FtsK/SpoIIIE